MFNSITDTKRMKCTVDELVKAGRLNVVAGTEESLYDRIKNIGITISEYREISEYVTAVGITDEFRKVIETVKPEEGITPAGFRHEFVFGGADRSLRIDLNRDIAFAENGLRRPGNILFSANTADPSEVRTMKDLIANLTTNPQIIYSNFLNNPKVNKNNQFKDRFEVLAELKELVGPGVDISVELNNPFADEAEIMEEVARFEEILTKYQLVVKVPHTGPLNRNNVDAFLEGSYTAYDKGESKDFFYGHNLAYKLQKLGYRVNFTLMAEPHQTALALLARPYFINAFVERRKTQTLSLQTLIDNLDRTEDYIYEEEIHDFMLKSDMLAAEDEDIDAAVAKARKLIEYRNGQGTGYDGLDSVRHSLRILKRANLPDARLIVCNMKSPEMYTDLDKLAVEPEFADMKQRMVVTCEPSYFSQFTSSPTVYCYQRSFLSSIR